MKINQLSPRENPYTKVLDSIAKPPKCLYFIGKLPEKRLPTVAIVGTRKPTKYGTEVTTTLASELARRGVVIISGLALGIDALAHKAALDADGLTIAVLGNGLPDIRPITNRDIGERIIASNGAIVSEHTADYVVGIWSFVERNRLIAGLSDAVIVTEAAARSGSLNTAMHALEQNKEVFVVPGNITSPLSAGCNALLKQGAHPATCVEDILEVIAPDLLKPQTSLALGNTPLETEVIKLLQSGVRDGDEIQQTIGCTATDLSVALTMLELHGTIRALGANQWTLR